MQKGEGAARLPHVHFEGLLRGFDDPALYRVSPQPDVSLVSVAPAETVVAPFHLQHVDGLHSLGQLVIASSPPR